MIIRTGNGYNKYNKEIQCAVHIENDIIVGTGNTIIDKTDPKYIDIFSNSIKLIIDGIECKMSKAPIKRGLGNETVLKVTAFTTDKLNKNLQKTEQPTKKLEENTKTTKKAIEGNISVNDLFKESKGETSHLVDGLSLSNDRFSVSLINAQSEAEILIDKVMEIEQRVEQGIVSNLTDAVMGTQSLADAAINVLNDLKRKLVEVAIQRATSGIGNAIGGFLGNMFGGKSKGGGGSSLFSGGGEGLIPFQSGLLGDSVIGFANGGRPPVGKASIVGERGPEIFVPSVSGTIIPNNQIGGGGGVTNMVTVNVDASGSEVQGNTAEANQLGQLIGVAIQEQLVKEKRPGGLLA